MRDEVEEGKCGNISLGGSGRRAPFGEDQFSASFTVLIGCHWCSCALNVLTLLGAKRARAGDDVLGLGLLSGEAGGARGMLLGSDIS